MTIDFGRRVFGAASLLLGLAGLALHDQLISDWVLPYATAFLVVTSAALIAGGCFVAFRRTERLGAGLLAGVYAIAAATFLPDIIAQPRVYAAWGNLFYPLATVSGALVAYFMLSPSLRARAACRAAVVLAGLCNASFAAEQLEFRGRTAGLVPKWMPPSGMFWAIATTVAFGLAAASLISGYQSLPAARLVASMLLVFGLAVWLPTLIADPKTHSNWSEGLQTFAIAGAAWIVADFLARVRSESTTPR